MELRIYWVPVISIALSALVWNDGGPLRRIDSVLRKRKEKQMLDKVLSVHTVHVFWNMYSSMPRQRMHTPAMNQQWSRAFQI